MKSQIKRFSKSTISVVLAICMLVSCATVGLIATDAAYDNGENVGNNEFNQKYLYVDMSSYSSNTLTGVNAYWNYNCDDGDMWNTTKTNMGDNIYRFDLSSMNSSYLYFRGFKVVTSGNSNTIGVVNGQTNNMIKVSSTGTLSWTSFSAYYVASGEKSFTGNSWDAADINGKMSVSGTNYVKTFSNVNQDTYKYKVTKDGNWDYAYPTDNIECVVPFNGASVTITKDNSNNVSHKIEYTHTASSATNGRVYVGTTTGTSVTTDYANDETTYMIYATPNSNYVVNTISVGGTVIYTNSSNATGTISRTRTYAGNETVSATFKVANTKLDKPTNVALASSTVTAEPNSTVRLSWTSVANAGSYKVFLDGTLKQTVTTAYYDIDKKASSAGDYTVVAVPSSAASYSESDPSSAVKLTVDKTSLPTPAVTINPLDIASGSSTTATFSNYSSLSSYISGGYATLTRGTRAYEASGGAFTTNTAVTSTSGSETLSPTNSIQYAYYMAVTATGSEYYYQSGNSAFYDVYVAVPTYKIAGGLAGTEWNYSNGKAFSNYTSDGIFYFVSSSQSSGDHYFSFYDSSNNQYSGNNGNSDFTITLGEENKYNIVQNTHAKAYKVSGSGVFIVFYDSVNNKMWVTQNTWAITPHVYYQTYNLQTDSYNNVQEGTTGGTIQPDSETLVTKNSSQTLTATPASGYTFVGWYKSSSFSSSDLISSSNPYAYTPNANGDYYALFKENVPAHYNLTLSFTASQANVSATYNGTTINTNGATLSVPVGATVTYSISAKTGAQLGTITPSGITSGTNKSYTMPSSSVTITVNSSWINYNLNGVTSPENHGTITFYKDNNGSRTNETITTANYQQYFWAVYTPADGYQLKDFSIGGGGASRISASGNSARFRMGSAAATVTATVVLQYSVTYYVDMHENTVSSLSISITDSNGTVLKNANNQNCTATLTKVNSKTTVYSAAMNTPMTQSGSGYSALYIMVTYNGTNYTRSLASNQVSALVGMSNKEIWLEAVNESSQPLNIQYSTTFSPESGSTPAVATGYRRIYLAKPKGWETSEPNWKNIKVYHWGNYNDMGWNNGLAMTYLGYGRMPGADSEDTSQYHYYYIDLPKYVNQNGTLNTDGTGNKVQNIIFQGWADNATSPSVQTGNIEKIPDSADFFILSKDGNSYEGTKSDEDVVIPTYARHASSVKMNVGDTTTVNITPVYTGAKIVYSSSDDSKVEVNETTGVITPRSSTINGSGTDVPVTITVKVYGSIGAKISDTANGGGDPHNGADAVIYTVSVSVHNPSKFNGFNIMAIESQTYTVSVPQIGSDQPGYFDMTRNGSVITVSGLLGVDSSTKSAIINPTTDNPTSFTVKYAKANNTFSGYSDIEIFGTIVTKSNSNTNTGKRYGLKQWMLADDSNPEYTISRKIENGTGIETATTIGVTFTSASSTYRAVFEEYQYVDVTFTFTYYEYKPEVDDNGTPEDTSDDMINYPYDSTWAGGEDTSNANFAASHTQKTVTVQNYEVRGKTADTVQPSDLVTPALTAIGVRPDNNYYNYSIAAGNITIPNRSPGSYTANAAVSMAHSVKQYKVYLNGELKPRSNPNDPNDNRTYYYYQEYAEPNTGNTSSNWYAVDSSDQNASIENAPLLATGVNSYKFRVKGSANSTNTYLRTTQASASPHGNDFLRSEVDFSHYEVTHQGSSPASMKEYLMQNFYIADFFSPAEVLDPNTSDGQGGHLPYDDAQFVGGGVVYYSMNGATENNQGTPFANAVSSGYVGNDGIINANAIKEMLKSNIEAQYAKDNIAGTVGEEDAMKAAYGTEIAATKNVEGGFNTGIIYRYLPLNQYTRYGSGEKTVDITVSNDSNITNYTLTKKDQTTQKWGCSKSQTSTADPEIANGKRTIRFTNNQNWDAVFVHFWGGSSASNWPGIRMTDKDNNVFEAVIPADATQIVFNDGCSMPATDENGSYTLDYSVNNNTFRYSNSLQSYQYVYASGNENKATNAGKNMRLYSYFVYSYTAYNQETNVPETRYEIVISDNYSDASTYWEGNPNPDPSN